MNNYGTCKNCGWDWGIHHYQTMQCPVGGREAPLNQIQEWKTTTFEAEPFNALEAAARIVLLSIPNSKVELAREVWGNTNTRIIQGALDKLRALLNEKG